MICIDFLFHFILVLEHCAAPSLPRYSTCWLARPRPLSATVAAVWSVCVSWSMLPLLLESVGVDTSVSSSFNLWHNYSLIYGFMGLQLALILMMNLAIVVTIGTLRPDQARVGKQYPFTRSNVKPR